MAPLRRELFATLVMHYWSHSGFGGDVLQDGVHALAGVPGVLSHGRYDVSSPLEIAAAVERLARR